MTTILLADNDQDFLDTRREFLEGEGYHIVEATNPTEVRQTFESGNIDLAILDIRLINDDDEKDISGLTLSKVATYRHIPKIILTGFQSFQYVQTALRQEANGTSPAVDFLAKQEGIEPMLLAIKNALAVSRKPIRNVSQRTIALILFLGAILMGVIGIVYSNPSWLIGTTLAGILFTLTTWRMAVE